MARQKSKHEQEEKKVRPREAVGLILFFIALFLLVCLVSYALPLLGGNPAPQAPDENWCGTTGYYIAWFLFSFFGVAAFLPLVLFFYLSVAAFRSWGSVNRLPFIVAGITGLQIAVTGLLGSLDDLIFPPQYILPGGYLGELLQTQLSRVFGGFGTLLLMVLLLVFSLMAAIRFSVVVAGRQVWGIGGYLKKYFTALLADRRKKQPDALSDSLPSMGKVATKQQAPDINIPEPEPEPVLPAVHEVVQTVIPDDDEQEFVAKSLPEGEFVLPPLSLLDKPQQDAPAIDRDHYYAVSEQLAAKLRDFGVSGKVVGVSPGPVVTTYEFSPAPGVKINKIVSLADDLALGLKAESVRIVGSIPGKAALGIEIPNPVRKIVALREILLTDQYRDADSRLSMGLGLDVVGRPVIADLAKMPHLLVAGATGAGKSVAINSFIASLLFKSTPEEVRLLMVDPKRIELSVYEDIPHLLHPVVVESKMASRALQWAVLEMERRYRLLEENRVKNIHAYNQVAEEKLPFIVIIVDELADLMMVASKDVEASIARLAQMARAAGMHLILATQRPSVDVLTGLIKANFPTRISFQVSSKIDSRTIIDGSGAEHLLGMGDMLFIPPGTARLQRIHGAYISEQEIERLVAFLKEQGQARYDQTILEAVEEQEKEQGGEFEEHDPKYDEAVAVVCETGKASISMVQRRLRVGYNRAARMIEMMESEGIVGPADGSKPREVLARQGYNE